jgi:hypothetical protein
MLASDIGLSCFRSEAPPAEVAGEHHRTVSAYSSARDGRITLLLRHPAGLSTVQRTVTRDANVGTVLPMKQSKQSRLSLWSESSFLSIGSKGSILSIGSVGSILSIGSIGSFASVGSIASAWSALSAMSAWSVLSVMSAKKRGGVLEAGR